MSERQEIPATSGEEFDEAVGAFCDEANVVRPPADADLRTINSFASHFADWWREQQATGAAE